MLKFQGFTMIYKQNEETKSENLLNKLNDGVVFIK